MNSRNIFNCNQKNLNFQNCLKNFSNLFFVGKTVVKNIYLAYYFFNPYYRLINNLFQNQIFFLFEKNNLILNIFWNHNNNKNIIYNYTNWDNFNNTLKNNFKLFLYYLYNNNFYYYANTSNINKTKIIFNTYFLNTNNYYISKENYSIFNKSLVKNYYKIYNNFLNTDNTLNKPYNYFKNYKWFYSNKSKRFSKVSASKELLKLKKLRIDLYLKEKTSIKGKFFYKFRAKKEYIHPFWQKEEFLKKKFKYFKKI